MRSSTATEALIDVALFWDLTGPQLEALGRIGRLRQLDHGDVLFREGHAASSFAVIAQGRIAVGKRREDGTMARIATVSSGQPIGEMAILDGGLRSATVVADGRTVVVEFPLKAFDDLMCDKPLLGLTIIRKLGRVLSLRLRRMSARGIQ